MQQKHWGKALYTVTDSPASTRRIIVAGRERWALESLLSAGAKGCTPIDHPAPRWSAYIHDLRREYGLNIETISEPHQGPFAGHHGRYVLHSRVARAGGAE
jgi:hypothetical protein